MHFSVAKYICESRVLQFLGFAEAVAVCVESCARIYVAQNYLF